MEYQPTEITDNTGKPYTVRSAQMEDAADLMAFAALASEESPFFPWKQNGCPVLWENPAGYIHFFLTDSRRALLLLRDGEEIVGLLELNGFGNHPEFRHRCTQAVGLRNSCKGRGLARSFWVLADSLAFSLGYEQAEGHVNSRNLPSLRAYEKNGWQLCGTQPRFRKHGEGSYSDKLIFVKKLTEDTV